MLELSTTATFDALFSKLPKPIQRKAASKTDLFRENPFTHPSTQRSSTPNITKCGAFVSVDPIESSLNSSAKTRWNSGTSATTARFYDYDMFK